MRLVTPHFLSHYNSADEMRVLNIHPALLPAFPGRHGYEDTFAYGCKWGGVTVHFVDEGEDTGPVIAGERDEQGAARLVHGGHGSAGPSPSPPRVDP